MDDDHRAIVALPDANGPHNAPLNAVKLRTSVDFAAVPISMHRNNMGVSLVTTKNFVCCTGSGSMISRMLSESLQRDSFFNCGRLD